MITENQFLSIQYKLCNVFLLNVCLLDVSRLKITGFLNNLQNKTALVMT